MSADPLRVACIGMGWWSDVLADAIQRSGKLEIRGCYTRSEEKRKNFAAKYRCWPAASYEALLADAEIEAIINTTPNDVHLATTCAAAAAGKHVFLDKPIANSTSDGRAITEACRKAGVMLQIGIHYIDVLAYLIGPIHAVRAQSAQLVLPGDNPDVASLILQHENGALSTLNASYASASEYYLMNIYGKDMTAFYDLHNGLRLLKRGENLPVAEPCAVNDTLVEELEEFAAAARGQRQHEVGGEEATRSLAVIRAGILSRSEEHT